jgi:hypothetical protein
MAMMKPVWDVLYRYASTSSSTEARLDFASSLCH